MALQSMPTAYATSGLVCVEQYSRAPTRLWYEEKSAASMVLSGLVSSASSTSFGRDSEAGALVLWKAKGTPSG
eukprot:5166793-Pleurochrysis_carterae.AAC.1